MNGLDGEIRELTQRLQGDLQALSGRRPGPAPRFRWHLVIPVVVLAGGAVLVAASPKARKSLLLKMLLLASTHLLQQGIDSGPRSS